MTTNDSVSQFKVPFSFHIEADLLGWLQSRRALEFMGPAINNAIRLYRVQEGGVVEKAGEAQAMVAAAENAEKARPKRKLTQRELEKLRARSRSGEIDLVEFVRLMNGLRLTPAPASEDMDEPTPTTLEP
jgi:hypothetical protein